MSKVWFSIVAVVAVGFSAATLATCRASDDPVQPIVERIQREVEYADTLSSGLSHEHLLTLAALNETQANVSASLYGYYTQIEGQTLKVDTSASIIEAQSGICGSSFILFHDLVERLGLKCRAVKFFYGENTHIAAEVWYEDAWHYYGPTWGAYFLKDKVLSVDEILTLPDRDRYLVQNQSLLWFRVARPVYGYDAVSHFGQSDLRVEYEE